jgi:hypothetical protein
VRRRNLVDRIPLAPVSAVLMGGAVAFFFFAMPMVLLEQGVIASGLPTLIAAAGPPLGATARTLVAGSFALLTGGITWGAITLAGLIGRPRRPGADNEGQDWATISIDHAERHDAPARRPIFASRELGAPLEPPVEELAEIFPEDDVLELVDILPDEPPRTAGSSGEAPPIAELMARLEAGAERRAARSATAAPAPEPPATAREFEGALRSALDDLKRMAAR